MLPPDSSASVITASTIRSPRSGETVSRLCSLVISRSLMSRRRSPPPPCRRKDTTTACGRGRMRLAPRTARSRAEPVQPFAEELPSLAQEFGRAAPCVVPKPPDGDIGRRRDLASVSDEPALEAGGGDLRVELQRQSGATPREGLIFVVRGRGEPDRTRRQIERVAVPVQHRLAATGKPNERRPPSLRTQGERPPADLLARPRIHPRPEPARHQLRAEADPERRP